MQRLLSKKEVESGVVDFRAQLVEERNVLVSEIAELTKRKNIAILELAEAERLHCARTSQINSEAQGQKNTLLNEITSLESRRREALKPIIEREKAVTLRETLIKETEQELALKASCIDDERAELVARIAALKDRESEIDTKGLMSESRFAKVLEAEAVNRQSTNALSLEWLKLRASENTLATSKAQWQTEINMREAEIVKEKEWIVSAKKSIQDERKEIASLRSTLQAAFDEGRKKRFL